MLQVPTPSALCTRHEVHVLHSVPGYQKYQPAPSGAMNGYMMPIVLRVPCVKSGTDTGCATGSSASCSSCSSLRQLPLPPMLAMCGARC
eukprot:1552470-Rhodomonas_salina.4